MNSKMQWIAGGAAVCLLLATALPSQQGGENSKTEILETEESVLTEKIQALEKLYEIQIKLNDGIPAGYGLGALGHSPALELFAGCDLHLAKAELSAVRGQSREQIQHLEKAVEFSEKAVNTYRVLKEAPDSPRIAEAIVRRADAKLALIRAKKKQMAD